MIQIRDFAANAASLLGPADGMGFYSPQPIRRSRCPPVLTGNVMDRTAQLPEDGRVTGNWATVFVQDVYSGLEPAVQRGEIKQIAVVQEIEKSTHTPQNNQRPDGPGMRNIAVFGFQFPLVSCGATYAPKKVWGIADVAPDGSAAFKVPSEVPIYFLALDGEGRAVQRMRSFTHLMPGEIQGCVGCHADRNSATPRPRQPAGHARSRAGASPTGLGRQGLQLSRGRPGRVRPELRRVPQRARAAGRRRPDRRYDRLFQRLVRHPLPNRHPRARTTGCSTAAPPEPSTTTFAG